MFSERRTLGSKLQVAPVAHVQRISFALARQAGAHKLLALFPLQAFCACLFVTRLHLVLLSPAHLRWFCGEACFHKRLSLIALFFTKSFVVRLDAAGRHLGLLRGCCHGKWSDTETEHNEGNYRDAGYLRHIDLLL